MEGGLRLQNIIKKNELNLPLVSVITVVRNGEKHIEQTLQSVFNQTYKNIEYIVIDGNSLDNTVSIIKKYDAKIDFWLSEPDQGLYFAMNNGINLSNGDLIGILNADDYYESTAITDVVNAYLISKASILHGDIQVIEQHKTTRESPNYDKMFEQPSIFHPTCFVKKEVYHTIGAFNTIYKISADYDFLLRCINHNYKFEYLPKVLTNFRVGGMSASCKSNIEGYKIMKKNKTGFHKQVILRAFKCYVKTSIKKIIHLFK